MARARVPGATRAAGVTYATFIEIAILDRRRGVAHSRRQTLLSCLLVPAFLTGWLAALVLGLSALNTAAALVWVVYLWRAILRGSVRPRPDTTRAQLTFLGGVAGYGSLLLVGAVAVGLVFVFPR